MRVRLLEASSRAELLRAPGVQPWAQEPAAWPQVLRLAELWEAQRAAQPAMRQPPNE